jgi:hypothetical protein
MSSVNPYATFGTVAAHASVDERAAFIRRTYLHLLAAVLAFVGLQAVIFATGLGEQIALSIITLRWGWLLLMGGFIGVSWLAEYWASSAHNPRLAYLGLGVYVVAEAIIFVPLLYLARTLEEGGGPIILPAALLTTVVFVGLTLVVFVTAKDFSFLRTALALGAIVAFGAIWRRSSSASAWGRGSPWRWWRWRAGTSCTTRRTCCTTIM